jgi:photosystem II stability/assembly factor-like uncharacterized protein
MLPVVLKAQHIELLQQGKPTSIRGLSVVDDNTAWISGSKGTIAITNNGGKTWDWKQVKGFEKSDFRDIEAFSGKKAIIMSSGTPAVILKTTDGGETWQVKYRNADTAYFFDAMDFDTPKHGLVLGDPIHGKFLLMETNDSGETWHPFKNAPEALPGEACFAASGTCLRFHNDFISIVTGGGNSRVLSFSLNNSLMPDWTADASCLIHGKASQGAFSVAHANYHVIVGGDYQHDKATDSVASYWKSRHNLQLSEKPPAGYQSCVEHVSDETFLSTGTPGSNITNDGGKTWRKIDDASYNVCRKAKNGKVVLLAGDHGRIGIFKP